MAEPDDINWGSTTESDTAYFRTPSAPMSSTLISTGYAGSDIPDNQDHNTIFRNNYLWQQYLLNRQKSTEPTILTSSGTATWNGSDLVLSANLDISFRKDTGKQVNRIASGTLTFGTDGHVLVLRKDFTTASPVTISSASYASLTAGTYAILAETSLTATNIEYEEVIFRRNGTNLEIPFLGLVYPTGSTITFGQSATGVVPVANGGTNISSYAVGDLIYASGTTTLSKLASSDAGKILTSGGTTTAPAWLNLQDGVYGLGVTYSAGTFTICKDDGTALSSTNFGVVVLPSTTAGLKVALKVTANVSFNDDAHASSDIIGEEFGTTAGAAWANDRPFYIYLINKDNTSTNLLFGISPVPNFKTTPSSSTKLGYKGNPASSPSDESIFCLTSSSPSTYTSKPCISLGSFKMQKSSADDWTVQALSNKDGFGLFNNNTVYTFPSGQKGNTSGKYFVDETGTAPIFSPNYFQYTLTKDGLLTLDIILESDGGVDGSGAQTAYIYPPYTRNSALYSYNEMPLGHAYIYGNGSAKNCMVFFDGGTKLQFLNAATESTLITYSDFPSGARHVYSHLSYQVF